jgi:hypothetical protein
MVVWWKLGKSSKIQPGGGFFEYHAPVAEILARFGVRIQELPEVRQSMLAAAEKYKSAEVAKFLSA